VSIEEDEFVNPCEEIIISIDTGKFMEKPSDTVDQHINDFIHVGRCRWDMRCFTFDRDPICNIEGSFQMKNIELSSSESWASYLDDPGIL
jgi:hypothetical protein